MKIKLSGYIYKDGVKVGSYGYSFTAESFFFSINGHAEYFYKKEELIQYFEEHGYTID